MCLAARNSIKTPILASKVKVIKLQGNQKPEYDFILVINSNLGLILHRFRDTATYWLKFAFLLPPLI